MKAAQQHPEARAHRRVRWPMSRVLLLGVGPGLILALALIGALRWRQAAEMNRSDPSASIPFRPKVSYKSSNVSITNTEEQPYVDTRLVIYVGATPYTARVGTIQPGETITRSLRILTNDTGDTFEAGLPKTSELEVRARFGGYDVHKDFPPP